MNAKRKTIAESLFGDTPKEKKSKSLAESLLGKEKTLRKPTDLTAYLNQIDPYYDEIMLMSCGADFVTKSTFVHKAISEFHKSIGATPLLVIIRLWMETVNSDRVFGQRYKDMMLQLLSSGLLLLTNLKHQVITLGDFIKPWGNLHDVVDDIRCFDGWGIEKQEDLVSFYCDFIKWLSEETFGYVPEVEDYDRKHTIKRKLPYDVYLKVISQLSLRERILAKIFYLGGSRSLEEVLVLKVEDVDFKNHIIRFSQDTITYSKHLLKDLKEYLEGRKKGFIFLGKSGERMDHTVPYRSLKTVTAKLNLEPSFTFKDFVKNL